MGYIGNAPYQGVVSGENIVDGSIDTADLKNGAVATAKIADGAVTAEKLAADAVFSSEPVRHSVRPSLLLDFANTKALDPRITFARASTATFYDQFGIVRTAAAGVARFEHNPVTGESLGLLIEDQRTNLLLRSEEFDNASWTKGAASIVANTVVAPDGTLTADKLVENTTNAIHNASQSFNPAGNTAYSASVYLKVGERTFADVIIGGFANQVASNTIRINLTTGVFTATDAARTTVTNVGNGWWRVSSTVTTIASPGGISLRVALATDLLTTTYLGNGFSGIYIWGAQLEAGAFATSYIPTVATQVTRSADAASMTGTNFSSWYRADEGTLYAEAASPSTFVPMQLSDGTDENAIGLRNRATGVSGIFSAVVTNSATQFNASGTFSATNKISLGYKFNDGASSLNGGAVQTDNTLIVPSGINTMAFALVAARFTGTIKKLAYYPLRLTNAQLQALTTT
jgi:hypothetical protein